MGLTEEQIAERLAGENDDDVFEVWAENDLALRTFFALSTQWRVGPLGDKLGLDYQGVRAAMRMMKIKDQAAMFEDLRVMERAALKVWSARHD